MNFTTKFSQCGNISVNEEGHLSFDGIDVKKLAKEYGTPLYLLSEDRVRENCRRYTRAVERYMEPGSMPLFAGKALCFRGIYPIIESEGFGADVVSPGEIYTALSSGFPPEKMYFHGNNKTDEDIIFALENGVGHFVVDNPVELERLDKFAGERGICQRVLLRVTVGLDPHTLEAINTGTVDSQFGAPVETGQAEALVREGIQCKNIELKGLHSHIGSQIFEETPFLRQVDILTEFAAGVRDAYGFTAEFLNIGGGFGVAYTERDSSISVDDMVGRISERLSENCKRWSFPKPKILMEPGRSIVADAGITLYTVGSAKYIDGYRNYITVDGGMTDNPRFALYGSDYTVLPADRMNEDPRCEYTVAGRCCESGDRIQEDVALPMMQRGDLIAVLDTGAYNYSMASNYNRLPRPALVITTKGGARLAVRRETFQDLIERESI